MPGAILRRCIIERLPHILGQLCRARAMPTYGCFDREYWAYGTCDVPNARKQEATLTLALLYRFGEGEEDSGKADASAGGTARSCLGNPALLAWTQAAIRYWADMQLSSGAFNDLFANEHSYVATAFSTYAVAEALRVLGGDAGDARDAAAPALRKACRWLINERPSPVTNQVCGAAAALVAVGELLSDARYREPAADLVKQVRARQHAEGWLPEYGGPDVGYLSVAIDYLGKYDELTNDSTALEIAGPACGFLTTCIHPDGSFGGDYGSRATAYLVPHGLAVFADSVPDAAALYTTLVKAVAHRRAVTATQLDDKYLLFNGYTYLQAAVRSVPSASPCLAPGPRFLDGCGWAVLAGEGFHVVANLRKGGAAWFRCGSEGPVVHDGGILLVGKGRMLTSCYLGASEPTGVSPTAAATRGVLARPFDYRMTPVRHLSLSAAAAVTSRWKKGRESFKRAMRSWIVTGDRRTRHAHIRRITIENGCLRVEDEVDVPWPCLLVVGASLESIYGESSRYFEVSQLDSPPVEVRCDSPGRVILRRIYKHDGLASCSI